MFDCVCLISINSINMLTCNYELNSMNPRVKSNIIKINTTKRQKEETMKENISLKELEEMPFFLLRQINLMHGNL